VAVIGVAVAVGLAACAVGFAAWRSGGEASDPGELAGPVSEIATDDGGRVSPPATDLPEIPAGQGIFSAVTMDASAVEPGGRATASGTLAMPEDRHGNVAISVSWVNPATSSVYARGITTLRDVQPDEQRTWHVAATLPPDAAGASAVLGAVIVGHAG
jgi:hypothetical protein